MTRKSYIPDGWPTVVPRIIANDAKELVDFIKRVFDATGEYREDAPTVLTIGGSIIMISDAGFRNRTAAMLYVYVPDADATYKRAVTARAHVLEKPADMPYGDRRCMIEDKWGNTWQIATYLRNTGEK